MSLRASLNTALNSLKTRLGRVGIGTPPIQQVSVSGPGVSQVRSAVQAAQPLAGTGARQIAEVLLPNALVTGGLTLVGTGDPIQAASTTALDLALGAGGLALAGKFAPGRLGNLTYVNRKGETVTDKIYRPSMAQDVALTLTPIASSMIMAGMQKPYQPQGQQQVATQQDAQRIAVNNLQQEMNVPGTQFQLQGLPERAVTGQASYIPPNVLDPYGLSRGAI
jgi:hypothetical protein